ncbi:MAG: helix-turn-helix domain-containing protein [Sedimentisphaerales bacterium]|nr:helix-turn-helix domain-containing protein [Sedimentisphaerales bacterium]
MQIGDRLRAARSAAGYTLKRVARETGIGQSSLSEFENDKREPRFSQLSRLAEVYKRSIEFFLQEGALGETVMLWRDAPADPGEARNVESRFRQLCEQYHRLELLMADPEEAVWPQAATARDRFDFKEAGRLAEKFRRGYLQGDIPSASLKQVLEERLRVKVFHLRFHGSAVSTVSPEFGPAVLLNSQSKLWRRNFDLAHELFHLLTWEVFRTPDSDMCEPNSEEDQLADAFASRLLLPTDAVKDRIEQLADEEGKIGLETLDEIAREFGVSLPALLWRMKYLYNQSVEEIQKHIEQAERLKVTRPPRASDEPDELPDRYCSLAIRALNNGKLSLIQFARYMGLGYKKAQEYLVDEGDLTDEEVSISVA